MIPIERLNAVLVVSTQPAYLDQAETWVERLDRVGEGDEPEIYVYNVQNARATNLAEVLGEIFAARTTTVGEPSLLAPGLEPVELGSTSGFELGASGDPRRGGARRRRRPASAGARGPRRAAARRCGRSRTASSLAQTDRDRPRGRDPHHRRRHHQRAGDPGQAARVPQDPRRAGEARRPAAPGADRGDHRRGHAERPAALRRRMVLPLGRLRGFTQGSERDAALAVPRLLGAVQQRATSAWSSTRSRRSPTST